MSSANNFPDPKGIMHPNQIEFMKHLSSWKTDSLIVKNEYFENDDHGSVDLISFYNGLQFIFDGYKLNYYINNHYEKFAKKLGHKFSPTESVINRLGYTYLFEKNDAEQALKMFKSNIENYPNSSNAYDSIADAYKELGNREMTIKSYEKAIELDPAYDPPRRKLEEYLKSTQIK